MRAECVIDGVAESPTRADVSPVDEHGPQRNSRRNVFLPRLAYTVQETAHVLGGICPKTVRRLIARKLLRPSRGLRCPLIPIWEIVRYLATTSGHSAKEQERLIQLFYESLLTVHGEPRPPTLDAHWDHGPLRLTEERSGPRVCDAQVALRETLKSNAEI